MKVFDGLRQEDLFFSISKKYFSRVTYTDVCFFINITNALKFANDLTFRTRTEKDLIKMCKKFCL